MVGYIYAKCRPYSPNISVLLIGRNFRPVRQTEIWILKSRLPSIEKIKIWYGEIIHTGILSGHAISYFSLVNISMYISMYARFLCIRWTKMWYHQMIYNCGYNHHFSFSLVNITNQSDRLYRLKFRF